MRIHGQSASVVREIIAVQDLKLGMFIAELDRAWLGTPFAIQGFLATDEEQLTQLRNLCRFVYVDRGRSVGEHWAEPEREPPQARGRRASLPRQSVVTTTAAQRRPTTPDVFTILRQLRGGSLPRPTTDRAASAAGRGDLGAESPRTSRPAASHAGRATEVGATRANGEDGDTLVVGAGSLFARLAGLLRWDSRDDELDGSSSAKLANGVEESAEVYPPLASVEEELITVAPVFQEASVVVEKLLHDFQRGATPDLKQVTTTVGDLAQSVVRNPDALIWLTRLKRTDQYAFDHALDVSVHLMVFGRFLGLPQATLEMLGTVGLMQDVGLVSLPPALLHKQGPLTHAEMKIFSAHVEHSVQIIRERCDMAQEVIDIVARHHERVDGNGYPLGLKGEEIGVYGEMAGLVDSYCAMLSQRPYRNALSAQRALEQINRLRNRKFSGAVIDQFIQCLGLYPVGTLVELESGDVAVVIAQNRIRRLKPKLMIILGPDKKPVNPSTVDLLFDPLSPRGEPHAIRQALPSDAYGIDPREYFLA